VFAYEPREPIEAMGDICIVNTDGSGWRNLTNRLDWDTDPDWSPDGSKIVYASRDGPRRELYTIAPDGSDKRLLRQDGLSNGTDQWPTYSPDGTKVAFTASSNAGGRGMNISVVDAEGDDYREIQSDLNSWSPSWSPGGTRIAFVADRDNDNADIYVMRADGKRVRRLTEHPGWDTWASWAPDGSEVAFLSGRDGGQRPRLYIVDADTGRVRRVSDRDDVSDKPTWVRATALGLSAARRKIVAWGWLRRPRGR
jgi:Tol biopolymer transport system component